MNAPHEQIAQTLIDIPYTMNTGETLVNETFGPGNLSRRRQGEIESRPMPMENGRPLAGTFKLEVNGFVFVEHKTVVQSFFDEQELKSVYYREVEDLIKRESGATRVVLFDHTLRSADMATREAQQINGGGRVLSVDPANGGWRVKLLKDGNVRMVFVPD